MERGIGGERCIPCSVFLVDEHMIRLGPGAFLLVNSVIMALGHKLAQRLVNRTRVQLQNKIWLSVRWPVLSIIAVPLSALSSEIQCITVHFVPLVPDRSNWMFQSPVADLIAIWPKSLA